MLVQIFSCWTIGCRQKKLSRLYGSNQFAGMFNVLNLNTVHLNQNLSLDLWDIWIVLMDLVNCMLMIFLHVPTEL